MNYRALVVLLACGLVVSACDPREEPTGVAEAVEPADLLLLNGYVYTVDGERTIEQAVAIRDGVIAAVGSDEELEVFRGEGTEVVDLEGRMVLPGLHDVHIHVFGIVEPDVCSLRSQPMSLEEMVPYLQQCIERYELPPGEWLAVDMWNFSEGNQTSERLPSLRAALDAVSTEHPIILWGNDGHHGAVNTMALTRARGPQGDIIGLNAETLAGPFRHLRDLVGVDDEGNPNGELNEHARNVVGSGPRRDPEKLAALLPQIGEVLAANGITSVQDAALDPEFLPHLKAFENSGQMRFRAQIANRADPLDYQDPLTGEIAIDRMLVDVQAARDLYSSELLDPSAVKIFADGVLEGNPYANPPTLPNGAVIEAYEQPLFEYDPEAGRVTVRGYVDTASPLCEETRANEERYEDKAARQAFIAEHGFHPGQCKISYGVMADPEPFMDAYVRALDEAGFTVHVHAIGDRAVRAAADALSQVVPDDGSNPQRHAMAHLQLVHPDDQQRIGRMGLYLAWTYAWMLVDPEYDLTVMPFLGDVTAPGGIYDPESYRMQNSYPVRSMMEAGAVTAAGSDAPVDDRSPRPFVNMAIGVTRQGEDGSVLNAEEAIDIHRMIEAYTINGARALMQENETGSIEPGKKADLAVLERNIVKLYDDGDPMAIADTKVDLTVFDGEIIYRRE